MAGSRKGLIKRWRRARAREAVPLLGLAGGHGSARGAAAEAAVLAAALAAADAAAAAPPDPGADAAARLAAALRSRQLLVRVASARGLRAADANGLSDPYCVVELGGHVAATRVERFTLDPSWGETFAFDAADVAAAAAAGGAGLRVALRVFDKDLLSRDDFLGGAALELAALHPEDGTAGEVDLPLRDPRAPGAELGSVQVSARFAAPPAAEGAPAGGAAAALLAAGGASFGGSSGRHLLSLLPAEAAAAGEPAAPRCLHARGGALYEEPLFACVALRVEAAAGLPSGRLDRGLSAASGSLFEGPPTRRPLLRLWRRRRAARAAGRESRGGGMADDSAPVTPFGARRGGSLGEDDVEEEDDDGELGTPRRARLVSSLARRNLARTTSDLSEDALEGDADEDGEDEGDNGGGNGGGGATDGDGASPTAAAAAGAGLHPPTGKFLYVAAMVGHQARVTKCVRERRGVATARWGGDPLALVAPLPMLPERRVRLMLFRTAAVTRRGAAIAVAELPLSALLPPAVLAGTPGVDLAKTVHRLEVPLALLTGPAAAAASASPGGADAAGPVLLLSVAVADLDARRALYGVPHVLPAAPAPASPPAGSPRASAGAGGTPGSPSGASGPSRHGGLSRLQSDLRPLRARDMAALARLDAEEFGSRERRLEAVAEAAEAVGDAAAGAVAAAAGAARGAAAAGVGAVTGATAMAGAAAGAATGAAWAGLAAVGLARAASTDAPADGASASASGSPGDVAAVAAAATPAPAAAAPPAPVPVPPATLLLSLHGLAPAPGKTLAAGYVFVVVRCGACWARTPAVAVPAALAGAAAGDAAPPAAGAGAAAAAEVQVAFDYELLLPVMCQSEVLTVAAFTTRRAPRASGLAARLQQAADAPVLLGRLRLRLSTLAGGARLSAALPMLADRRRGGRAAAVASLTLRLDRGPLGARLGALFAPPLPREHYYLGLSSSSAAAAVAAQRRALVLRWLAGAAPPVPEPVARAVLGTEAEEFAMSRVSANWRRIRAAFATLGAAGRGIDYVSSWESAPVSLAACAVVVALCYAPSVTVPLLMLWAAERVWRGRDAASEGLPRPMEADAHAASDDEDEERALDAAVPHYQVLRRKYLSLTRAMLKVQNFSADVAGTFERLVATCSWEDPLATAVVLATLVAGAAAVAAAGLRAVLCGGLLFMIRHPALRTPTPPPPSALFAQLPVKADRMA